MNPETTPDSLMYLQPTAKIEPLICRWPASPHLIAPATRAMNLANRYLSNLKSFVANPRVHTAAAKDPAMLGGPFVDLPESEVPRVRDLIATTLRRADGQLKFAEAFRNLDKKVQTTADGSDLEHLYSDLPSTLSGLVDFVYDLNDHPSIKIMEALLYDDFEDSAFEEICLHKIADRDRKFVMSTPLLDGPTQFVLPLTFRNPLVDELANMRLQPMPLGELRDKLAQANLHVDALDTFITSQAPVRVTPQYKGDSVRIRYLGHACVLIQTDTASVLLDPLTAWERDSSEASLTFDDLPDFIDYVVITHGHQDHFVPEFLIQLRRRVGKIIVPRNDQGNLADPSMKLMLQKLGFERIEVLDSFDRLPIPDGSITSIPFVGEHAGLNISSKQCVIVTLKGRNLFFLVDSNVVDPNLYRRIAKLFKSMDAVFIGMECHGAPLSWLYGPFLSRPISRKNDEARRLSSSNCARAWEFLKAIPCARVYIYAMGCEPWLRGLLGLEYGPGSIQITEADALVARCRENGTPAERLRGCREIVI